MHLQSGVWNKEQIVPARFIDDVEEFRKPLVFGETSYPSESMLPVVLHITINSGSPQRMEERSTLWGTVDRSVTYIRSRRLSSFALRQLKSWSPCTWRCLKVLHI